MTLAANFAVGSHVGERDYRLVAKVYFSTVRQSIKYALLTNFLVRLWVHYLKVKKMGNLSSSLEIPFYTTCTLVQYAFLNTTL